MGDDAPPYEVPDTPVQILLTPSPNAPSFQVGYLGVQPTSVEGEVHIKGAAGRPWEEVTMRMTTMERTARGSPVVLSATDIVIYTAPAQSTSQPHWNPLPNPIPFSILLTPDLPEALKTPSLSQVYHELGVTLVSPSGEHVISTTDIQLSRYTDPSEEPIVDPISRNISEPAHATLQISRKSYTIGEPIPVYITIPAPVQSLLASGLRLRNVKVALIREVTVHPGESTDGVVETHTTQISHSGAACRFHPRRPVKLRLVLPEYRILDGGGSITQSSLLHSVSFHLTATISFTSSAPSSMSANSATMMVPVSITPPRAPQTLLPGAFDFEADIEEAYHKKHDRPPERTVRADGRDSDLPAFDDHPGHAASPSLPSEYLLPPSFSEASISLPGTAPPPSFDETENAASGSGSVLPPSFADAQAPAPNGPSPRGQPPPTFDDDPNRLPSFVESESELTEASGSQLRDGLPSARFSGEGVLFGFPEAEVYDGLVHEEVLNIGSTDSSTMSSGSRSTLSPSAASGVDLPPSIDASLAAGVAEAFASIPSVTSVPILIQATGSVPPPHPPAMDDPADPPPSIDAGVHTLSHEQRTLRERAMDEAAVVAAVSDGPPTVPPPYLGDEGGNVEASGPAAVQGPPPYVD